MKLLFFLLGFFGNIFVWCLIGFNIGFRRGYREGVLFERDRKAHETELIIDRDDQATDEITSEHF